MRSAQARAPRRGKVPLVVRLSLTPYWAQRASISSKSRYSSGSPMVEGIISRRGVPSDSGQNAAYQPDVHAALGQSGAEPVRLRRAVRRVVLAHDAAQVAVVRVSVEGDAPRPRFHGGRCSGGGCTGLRRHRPFLSRINLAYISSTARAWARISGALPSRRLQVAPVAQPPRQLGVIGQSLHLPGQRSGIAVREEQPVLLVADVLCHAAVVGGDDRDAGLLRLVDDQRRVLGPDGRHHDGVASVEHVRHDVLVAVLAHPLDALPGGSGQIAGQRLETGRFHAPVTPPDAQAGIAGQPAEGPVSGGQRPWPVCGCRCSRR